MTCAQGRDRHGNDRMNDFEARSRCLRLILQALRRIGESAAALQANHPSQGEIDMDELKRTTTPDIDRVEVQLP